MPKEASETTTKSIVLFFDLTKESDEVLYNTIVENAKTDERTISKYLKLYLRDNPPEAL